jgi:tetratricopeptide (TPR) repeat protein
MITSFRLSSLLALFAILVLAAPLLFSQTGGLKGRITDATGQPLEGVKITLLDPSRGQTYTRTTDKNGKYSFKDIFPSEYRLKLEIEGFQGLEVRMNVAPGRAGVYDTALRPEVKKPEPPAWRDKGLRANELYAQQKYGEALALYREILDRNPELAVIHFDAGNCLYHLEEYDAAIKAFREATRLKPDFAEAYTNLANSFAKLKKYDEAIPILENALRLTPGTSGLFLSIGRLYLSSGQASKAAYYLEKATMLNPKSALAYHSLGVAYAQTEEYSRAIENYEKYIGLITDAKEIDRVKAIVDRLKPLVKR